MKEETVVLITAYLSGVPSRVLEERERGRVIRAVQTNWVEKDPWKIQMGNGHTHGECGNSSECLTLILYLASRSVVLVQERRNVTKSVFGFSVYIYIYMI